MSAAGRNAPTPFGTEWIWAVAIGVLALIIWHLVKWWFDTPRGNDGEETAAAEWDFTEIYPYYTEPPEPERLSFELREPCELTPALLRQLEWKRLEELVCAWYAAQGVIAQPTHPGAVGGSNLLLYRAGEHRPFAGVACSPAHEPALNVRRARELVNLMAAAEVECGVFISAGEIGPEVRATVGEATVEWLDGSDLVARFAELRVEERDRILHAVLREDYRTPTCPNCQVKMVLDRTEPRPLWRCPNFPRCNRKMAARSVG